jgi:prevent-host-death family protein
MHQWSVREAKDHLSELIEAANHAPQAITNRGKQAAVVLSQSEYDRLLRLVVPLTEFFARSGLDEIAIERVKASPRKGEGQL